MDEEHRFEGTFFINMSSTEETFLTAVGLSELTKRRLMRASSPLRRSGGGWCFQKFTMRINIKLQILTILANFEFSRKFDNKCGIGEKL